MALPTQAEVDRQEKADARKEREKRARDRELEAEERDQARRAKAKSKQAASPNPKPAPAPKAAPASASPSPKRKAAKVSIPTPDLPSVKVPPVVPWVLGFVGIGLVYSAVRNTSPFDMLRGVITGQPSGSGKPIDRIAANPELAGAGGSFTDTETGDPDAGGGGGFGARGDSTPTAGERARYALVAVSNAPGYQPAKVYMGATMVGPYLAWCKTFGAHIPLTGAWRSEAEQAANHKANPGTFAATSQHTKGLALDVNNTWLQKLSEADQSRLRKLAKAVGFGQARYKRGEAGCGKAASGKSTDNDEPWHFSHGVCG